MLGPRILHIGRSSASEIILTDLSISNEHAEMFVDPQGNVFLTDMQSISGTFVNGNKLYDSVLLTKGDTVVCGNSQFIDWEHLIFNTPKKRNPLEETTKVPTSKSENKHKSNKENRDLVIIYAAIIILIWLISFRIS
jgi:pSer/pThr/pTyr-binding forkhead associated (FHA) protein